jgi:hypothetical protein
MYTRYRDALARLRAYYQELSERYHDAVVRRNWASARAVYDLRHRVGVAIRWHEEWDGAPPPLPTGRAIVEAPTAG